MKTRTISPVCLAILTGLLPGLAEVQAKPDEKADTALAKLATEKRDAGLKFTWKVGGGETLNALGAFVSKDGLALVALEAITMNQVPTVVTAEGNPLKFGTILKLFPEQGAALMKFNHKPDVIVLVGKEEPEIGETIALIPWNSDAPQLGKIPPVVGDIMVKRHDISSELKEPKFLKVLSLGSGLSGEQERGLAGSFAIDVNGNLVARFLGVKPYPGQTLITLFPVADIADEIVPLAKGEKGLKHPLSPAVNPLDPAMLDPDYTKSMMAMMQRDMATVRRLIKDLMKRHPNSLMLQTHAANLMVMDPAGREPLIQLEDVSPIELKESKARQFLRHWTRSVLLSAQEKSAIPELVKAMECSPKDCPDARSNLAGLYLQASPPRLAEAAELYRQMYPYLSDTIALVEQYEQLLNELGKGQEAAKVNDRFWELDTVYRQRRGEAR